MSNSDTLMNPTEPGNRFLSLASLRAAHSDLLQLHRAQGKQPQVLEQIQQLLRKGQATGAVLESEDDRWAAQSLLDYWSSLLYREGVPVDDVPLAEFDASLAPTLDDDLCPYLGLEAFRENNHNYFFGRQRLLETLLEHLKHHRFLAVVGSSGSGKSSVILGGLIPKLKSGCLPDSEYWHYYSPVVPGSNPLLALARRLQSSEGASQEWLEEQVQGMRQDPGHLLHLIQQTGHQTVLLCIDQFEEVFPLEGDFDAQKAFVDNLVTLVQAPDSDHRVILTMRIDFEDRVVKVPGFRELFEQSRVQIPPLDANELREAIEKPAELIGLKFEDGLVDALVKDALGEPAALPLLQFTLLKLWENRDHNRLTWAAYQNLGGGRRSLARCADEFYNNLIPQQQETAKRILLSMVQIKEGIEVTSQRIPRQSLYRSGEAHDQVDAVLNKLIQARLVRLTEGDSPDEAQVEVAHEALIRNWECLRDWLNDERVTLRQRIHLRALAEQWKNRNQDSNLLLRGSFLAEAQTYTGLSQLERQFIERSQKAEKRKSQIRIGITAIVFAALSALAIIATMGWITAKTESDNAKEEAKRAKEQASLAANQTLEANNALASLKALSDLKAQNPKLLRIQQVVNELNMGKIDEKLALERLDKIYAEFNETPSPVAIESPATSPSPTPPPSGKIAKVTGTPSYLRNVRSGPGTASSVICIINGGINVEIITTQSDRGGYPWYQIKAPKGCPQDGWIAAHLVDVINGN